MSYGLFFGISLVPVICLIYIACVYSRFKIYQETGGRSMVCGEAVPYFFVLQNEDHFAYTGISVRLFSDFSYVEELPGDREYELLPGEKYTFETRLVCRYRGEYEVGVRDVTVTDFFRLFRVSYANPGTVKALVRPRIVRLSELRSIGDFRLLLQREAPAETEPDAVVREYVQGDPLKRIHWKATAAQGRLMTRLRTGEENQGIAVLADIRRFGRRMEEYLPLENKILEVLLALGFFLAGRDIAFSFACGQKHPVELQVSGMRDFDAFYQSAAQINFDGREDFVPVLEGALAAGRFWDSKMIFLVLHEVNDRIMEITGRLAAQGRAVVLYAVTDDSLEEYLRQDNGRRRLVPVPVEGGPEEAM